MRAPWPRPQQPVSALSLFGSALPSPPVAGPPVVEPKVKAVSKIKKPVGRGSIDRAIAKVNRDYDVPRKQVEPLVCAVVNEITA